MEFLKITKLFAQDFYAVPDYQRDYEWTNAQTSTLIDDVFALLDESANSTHFLGAIVTIPYEDNSGTTKSIDFDSYSIDADSVKHIVDGQQRLTSFSVLLKVLYDCLKNDPDIDDEVFRNNHLNMLRPLFCGTAYDGNGNAAPRLILNGNTGFCFNKEILAVRDDPCNKVYRGAKRLLGAYNLFKYEITNKKAECLDDGISAKTFYKNLIDILLKKIVFVEIECDASSDAFQVFDSLNGKGLDLTAADRIKNIMMSWSPSGKGAQKWDALVQQVGEDYLVNFFVCLFFYNHNKRISKNKLPEKFKDDYKDSATSDFDYFYNELKAMGSTYGALRNAKTENESVDNVLKDFQALGFEQVFVMLFAAAWHYGVDCIASDEFKRFTKTLLALIVRMQVCERNMNKLDSVFSDCIEMMKTKSASISVITDKLNEKKKNIVTDEQFENDFAHYCPTHTRVEEFYLRHLEEYRRTEEGNRSSVERGLTVEHIIPQTLDDLSDWYGDAVIPDEVREDFQLSVVENIGNKMLLYGDDNASASNNDYQKKCETYRTGKRGQDQGTPIGTFKLANDLLVDFPERFNHEEVDMRAKQLAKYAVSIWR